MNKAPFLLAAVLALPATAMAQTAPPLPGPTPMTPAMAPQHMRHRMSDADMQAMMAKMKANMAKIEAAHKALRAKILGTLTPAHKAYFANLIGQLAVSTSPDWEGAVGKLNATLSAAEKSEILALHADALKQMEAMMPHMGMPGGGMSYKRVIVTKNADGTTSTTTSDGPGFGPPGAPIAPGQPMTDDREMHVAMLAPGGMAGMAHMHGEMGMKHAMTAGDILMHLAGPAESGEGMPMMMRVERFGHGDMNWKRMSPTPVVPPVAPAAPAAAPTSTP